MTRLIWISLVTKPKPRKAGFNLHTKPIEPVEQPIGMDSSTQGQREIPAVETSRSTADDAAELERVRDRFLDV